MCSQDHFAIWFTSAPIVTVAQQSYVRSGVEARSTLLASEKPRHRLYESDPAASEPIVFLNGRIKSNM
jgi:hypothetical protein